MVSAPLLKTSWEKKQKQKRKKKKKNPKLVDGRHLSYFLDSQFYSVALSVYPYISTISFYGFVVSFRN